MKSPREVYKLTGEPHAVETALGHFTFRFSSLFSLPLVLSFSPFLFLPFFSILEIPFEMTAYEVGNCSEDRK